MVARRWSCRESVALCGDVKARRVRGVRRILGLVVSCGVAFCIFVSLGLQNLVLVFVLMPMLISYSSLHTDLYDYLRNTGSQYNLEGIKERGK